jgi:hypothetical protein
MQMDQTIFDWCDLSAYNPQGVKALLEAHHINQSMVEGGFKWIALNPAYSFTPDFALYGESQGADTYVLTYDLPLAIYVQKTGAIGVISFDTMPTIYPYINMGGIRRDDGLVLQSLVPYGAPEYQKKLPGSVLTIFGGFIPWHANDEIEETIAPFKDQILATRYGLQGLIEMHRNKNTTFSITHMADDRDPVNYVYADPAAPFYQYHRATTAVCATLSCLAIVHNMWVYRNYRRAGKKGGCLNWYFVCLLNLLLGNVCRAIMFLDPWALIGILTFEQYFVMYSSAFTFHCNATISSMIVFFDMVLAVEATHKMKFRTIVYTADNRVRVAFFVILTFVGLFDYLATFYT